MDQEAYKNIIRLFQEQMRSGTLRIYNLESVGQFFQSLLDEVKAERVRIFYHNDLPIVGFDYTVDCQFKSLWNSINIQARGLAFSVEFNSDMNRWFVKQLTFPFPKFYNLEELAPNHRERVLNSIDRVEDKADGSLILTYWWNDSLRFMTRGSFHSPQSIIAKSLFFNKYYMKLMDEQEATCLTRSISPDTFTCLLFELVGPSNINVCRTRYKEDELILLSDEHINWGLNSPIVAINRTFKRPIELPIKELADIKTSTDPNFEGGVLIDNDGNRYKLKSLLYIQLHKLLSGTFDAKRYFNMWVEHINSDRKLFEQLKDIPDEFYKDIKEEFRKLDEEYNKFLSNLGYIYGVMRDRYLEETQEWKLNQRVVRKGLAIDYPNHRYLLDYAMGHKSIMNIKDTAREVFIKQKEKELN